MDSDITIAKKESPNIDDDIERLFVSFLASRVREAVKEVLLEQEARSNVRVDGKERNPNAATKDKAPSNAPFQKMVNDRLIQHSTSIVKNDSSLTDLKIVVFLLTASLILALSLAITTGYNATARVNARIDVINGALMDVRDGDDFCRLFPRWKTCIQDGRTKNDANVKNDAIDVFCRHFPTSRACDEEGRMKSFL